MHPTTDASSSAPAPVYTPQQAPPAPRPARLPAGVEPAEGGVTAPEPFVACGLHAGLKRSRPDLALLYSPQPCSAAACFTTNRVQAPPLQVTREHLRRTGGVARAVVVNSGNANACTGPRGLEDAREMAREVALALRLAPEEVLVASTGVIGVPLPMEKLRAGIREAALRLSRDGGHGAAQAILTTDTRVKEVAVRVDLGHGRQVVVGGMAKGSGMIHPQMATMLAFVTTDAPVAPDVLRMALQQAVDDSFNMVTVDGDTSTNDMVVALASGSRGGPSLQPGSQEYRRFLAALQAVCVHLAREIARDGEGARHLLEVHVTGAGSVEEARQVARTVAGSNLVKSAVAGADPNWGRIAAAAGRAGVPLDPDRLSIWLGSVQVVERGVPASYREEEARQALLGEEVYIRVDLGGPGSAQATAWGCDLTCDYVHINASYRT